MTDGTTTQGFNLAIDSYPYGGPESTVKDVLFGPASDLFSLLVEIDPTSGNTQVTIGNGAANENIPEAIPAILRSLAESVEGLGESREFWMNVGREQARTEALLVTEPEAVYQYGLPEDYLRALSNEPIPFA